MYLKKKIPTYSYFQSLNPSFQKALSLPHLQIVGASNHLGIQQEIDTCRKEKRHSWYSEIIAYFLRNKLGGILLGILIRDERAVKTSSFIN